jgi:ribosomal protein S18 acetylase RimI-like enzyme
LTTAVTGLPVRALTQADLPAIVALTTDRAWPPAYSRWRLLFAVSEPYGVDDPAGGLAGMVVLTRYGPALAAIGMMVVASRHGRLGLGRKLMEHALALAGGATVYLTATGEGRPLYERVGFRAVDRSVTYAGQLDPDPAGDLVPARRVAEADVAAIAAADLPVFGGDRHRVLAQLVTFADDFQVRSDPADGYAACWRQDDDRVVGPVVARTDAGCQGLISRLASAAAGPVRVDILGRHENLARWAQSRGLTARNETTLMVTGGDLPGDRARLYCPVSVAIG